MDWDEALSDHEHVDDIEVESPDSTHARTADEIRPFARSEFSGSPKEILENFLTVFSGNDFEPRSAPYDTGELAPYFSLEEPKQDFRIVAPSAAQAQASEEHIYSDEQHNDIELQQTPPNQARTSQQMRLPHTQVEQPNDSFVEHRWFENETAQHQLHHFEQNSLRQVELVRSQSEQPLTQLSAARAKVLPEARSASDGVAMPAHRLQGAAASRRRRTTYSTYCHVCSRKGPRVQFAYCNNLLANQNCTKVVCDRCLSDQNMSFDEAALDITWICLHCQNSCPDYSRCKLYTPAARMIR
mmetsp:Transcript_8105/g.21441  ORF Transcript_8105/g.21441 Transcript_8105/m.21441 type:complete len:299 (-) Transcript_8105:84-980(-)